MSITQESGGTCIFKHGKSQRESEALIPLSSSQQKLLLAILKRIRLLQTCTDQQGPWMEFSFQQLPINYPITPNKPNYGNDRTGKVLFVPPAVSRVALLYSKQGKKKTELLVLHKHHNQDLSEKTAETQPWNVVITYQDSGKKSASLMHLSITFSLFPLSLSSI